MSSNILGLKLKSLTNNSEKIDNINPSLKLELLREYWSPKCSKEWEHIYCFVSSINNEGTKLYHYRFCKKHINIYSSSQILEDLITTTFLDDVNKLKWKIVQKDTFNEKELWDLNGKKFAN